jgi:excisionase family DNA binding protein
MADSVVPLPTLLTVPEVCQVLGKSESAVRKMLNAGLLPLTRVGGAIRVDARKLAEWVEAGGRGYGRKGPLPKKDLAGSGRSDDVTIREGVS